MSTKDSIIRVLGRMSEEQLQELLKYAQFVSLREESAAWQELALQEIEKCYGPDEPEYTESDIKPELNK